MKLYFTAVCCVAATFLNAQNWTGAVNSDWNNSANWDQMPQNGDNITVSMGNYSGAMQHPVVSTNSTFSPAGVLIDGGAVLTINANLTTTDRVEVLGAGTQVVMNSGTLTISGGPGNARIIFGDLAEFIVEGGTVNVGQRLLFELGGIGILNAGTVTIIETFALIDGVGLTGSHFTQNGGTLTTSEFALENEAGNFHTLYTLNDGVLNVESAFLVTGVAPGAGVGEVILNGGVVNMQGTMVNPFGSTMNYNLKMNNDAQLNMTGATLIQLAQDSLILQDNAVFAINGMLTWTNDGVITGSDALIAINETTVLAGNGSHQFPNMTLAAGKLFMHTSPYSLSVNGDMDVAGTYLPSNNTLIFNGTQAQNLSIASMLELHALTLNNAAEGVTANNTITIANNVTWLDGNLNLGSNRLIFLNNAQTIGQHENSYAIGKVVKFGDDAFVFPVGSAGLRYRPVAISAPDSAMTSVEVLYQPQAWSSLSPVAYPLQSVSALEYWHIDRTGSQDALSINLGWNNALESGLNDCNSTTLAYWDTTEWSLIPSVTNGLCAGNNAGDLQSTVNVQNFGIFTLGFTEGVYQQAFTICYGDSITVGNNSYTTSDVYFDLLTDTNNNDSLVVTALTVLPQINTTVTNNIDHLVAFSSAGATYQWLDCGNNYAVISDEDSAEFHPTLNGNYAVEITLNGCVDTSECAVIDQLSLEEDDVLSNLYPNPVTAGSVLHVNANFTAVTYQIVAIDGKTVKAGRFENTMEVLFDLPTGMYLLQLQLTTGQTVIKEVVVN